MFRNYFTTAFRSFWRNKVFSLINILGLAVGISASLIKRLDTKIIQDKQVHLFYFHQLFDGSPISLCYFKLGKQAGSIGIQHFKPQLASLVANSRGKKALACSCAT